MRQACEDQAVRLVQSGLLAGKLFVDGEPIPAEDWPQREAPGAKTTWHMCTGCDAEFRGKLNQLLCVHCRDKVRRAKKAGGPSDACSSDGCSDSRRAA